MRNNGTQTGALLETWGVFYFLSSLADNHLLLFNIYFGHIYKLILNYIFINYTTDDKSKRK